MTSSSYNKFLLGSAAVLAMLVAVPVHAEKADRLKKMEIEADQPGKVDIQKKVVTFNGNVVVSQGTMSIRAASIEVREDADGYQNAVATGGPGSLARFRQKRDGVNEWVEGEARRIEYNGKAGTLKLITEASARRLNGSDVADQARGALIVYDNSLETFTVSGGAVPGDRVRVEIAPRKGTAAAAEAAAEAASQASAPGSGK